MAKERRAAPVEQTPGAMFKTVVGGAALVHIQGIQCYRAGTSSATPFERTLVIPPAYFVWESSDDERRCTAAPCSLRVFISLLAHVTMPERPWPPAAAVGAVCTRPCTESGRVE